MYFQRCREEQITSTNGVIPRGRLNADKRREWWGVTGRTLEAVLDHIEIGNPEPGLLPVKPEHVEMVAPNDESAPCRSESESAPRSRRPSAAENNPSPTSSSAASSAGDADGRAAADDHEAVADRRLGHEEPAASNDSAAGIDRGAHTARTLNPLNADTFAAAAAQFAGEVAGSHYG
ncbi:hypothetical protein TRIUR3_14838 [Triticum urartu]|uniref:Uncharacterized protein n=1 Tax=Triticum urartu TaxID=4572 RepID=M7Z3E5_TRIUA|nr:hypothetical protein TRIUR3_14838 [Triticum urartu]